MLVWNWYSTGIILAFRFVKILATVFNLGGKESLICIVLKKVDSEKVNNYV